MSAWFVAIGLGFVAGVITSVALVAMGQLEAWVWAGELTPLRVFLTIMAGALLIALLRPHAPDASVDAEIDEADSGSDDTARRSLRAAAYFTALGIVSVAFGAALGPEGGILALVGQLSTFVAHRLGKTVEEARLYRRMGTAGALGGLYLSPPGGAGFADGRTTAPWPLLLVAGLAGFAGLMLASAVLPKGHGLQIPLPAAQSVIDLNALLPLLLAAALGALLGLLSLASRQLTEKSLLRLTSDVRVQVLAGSLVFAGLAAVWPIALFNGQQALAHAVEQGWTAGPGMLVGAAALKAVAVGVCLAAGWLGGPVMPVAFVGAAGGMALAGLVPGLDAGLAAAAAVGAAETVVLRRPVVALLVIVFTATTATPMAVLIGVMIGWGVSAMLPAPAAGHH